MMVFQIIIVLSENIDDTLSGYDFRMITIIPEYDLNDGDEGRQKGDKVH